ncbi:MAG TPA: Ig-like domain-containing protein [Verrucomicrobiae bacterium]|jgi:chitodextrinase|nr:Ig-like domain-containing protein [Verrucomicrobiae bacterium]
MPNIYHRRIKGSAVNQLWHAPVRLAGTLFTALLLTIFAVAPAGLAQAACANTPNASLGTSTQTVNVTSPGTYYVWSRILAPDTTNNSYYLQVDGGCAIDVGDSASIPANTFTWVNYQNGTANSPISVNLTAGANQIVMTGREPGVGVDRVLFLGDQSCTPTGTGNNCTPAPDTTPPTVSMDAPSNNATVSGTTTVSANATDNVAVQSVQFELDGNNLGSPVTTPTPNASSSSTYSYSWNTAGIANGSHKLTAVATDTSGNQATATSVTVTVNNQTVDKTPPTVSISAPANNATVSGTTQVSANASDNVAVKSVQLELDGKNLGGVITTAPYSYNWDTSTASNGTHILTAIATDTSNNTATATNVTVTVNNPTSTPTPNAPTGLTAPTVTSTQVVLKWAAPSGNDAAAKYNIYRNGSVSPLATITTPTTTYTDSTVSPSTSYSYTVTAVDAAGNQGPPSTAVAVTTPAASTNGGGGSTTTVQNLAFNPTTKTLSWSAYPGASSYGIAQVHNPTTTRNTDYSWPHVTATSCIVPTGCGLPATPGSGETVNYSITPLGSNGSALSGTTWAKEITVTWPTTTDNQPPSQPTNLTAVAVSSSQINLSWTASTDNVGVTSYNIYRGTGSGIASLVGSSPTDSFGDSGLSPSTTYTYYVVALDAAKNTSPASSKASAVTQAASTTGTAILEGVITNSRTRQPINRAWVYTSKHATANGEVGAYTNAQGQYVLSGLITAYKHSFYYGANGYQYQSFYLQFPAGINTKNVSLNP